MRSLGNQQAVRTDGPGMKGLPGCTLLAVDHFRTGPPESERTSHTSLRSRISRIARISFAEIHRRFQCTCSDAAGGMYSLGLY